MDIRQLLLGGLLTTGIALDTCDVIRSTDIEVAGPLDLPYVDRWYWNRECTDLQPSCVLLPASTQEVADIVSVLKDTDEEFAVKSGGHNPNVYFASVGGGPLISTERLNEVTLDEEAGTVRVGPGNRWDDVIGALDGTGYTVPGGRVGHVGVGGLLLGNGLSFLSAQHGWAANSVLEYDLVLANGTAVTASASSHPDLFLTLRGGGNNFGIVTSFLMRAYTQPEIWGGSMTFTHSDETSVQLLDALREFAGECTDEKAAVILAAARVPDMQLDIWILYTFYDGPTPPEGIFDSFEAAGPISDTSATKSYLQLMIESNDGVIDGTIYTMATESLPLPEVEHSAEVLGAIHKNWRSVSDGVLGNATGIMATTAYQPFTKRMASLARENGGDLMDVDDDVDRIIVEYNYNHALSEHHELSDRAIVDTYEGVSKLVRGFQESGELPEVYLPLFVNDAYFRQDYFGRLKPERAELAKRVAEEVDSAGLWRSRTGGFKP